MDRLTSREDFKVWHCDYLGPTSPYATSSVQYRTCHALLLFLSWCAPVAQRLEQQTHNLLVRGSSPCGGTNELARCLTLTSSSCWADSCSTSRWRDLGSARSAGHEVSTVRGSGWSNDPDTLLRLTHHLARLLRPMSIHRGIQTRRRLVSVNTRHKSGSCLYLYLEHAGRIHLLYLFSKGDQSDLSPQQKQTIGALSQEIRKER